jgi:hypothetical protein
MKKKILTLVSIFALSVSTLFAATHDFQIKTTVDDVAVFKVLATTTETLTYAKVIDSATTEDLEDELVNAETEVTIKTLAAATNREENSTKGIFKITANADPLTCDNTKTPMGYTLTIGTDPTVVLKSAASTNIPVFSFTGDGTQQVAQKDVKAIVTKADWDAAAAGDYAATISFNIAGA